MKSLIENCKRRNTPFQSIPQVNGRKLFLLYMLVQRLGGYEQITRNQQWDLLAQKLQVPDSQQLAAVYYKIILPYERYLASSEGQRESQAKKIFFQQFFQELLKKIQPHMNNQQQQAQMSTPSSSGTPVMTQTTKQQQKASSSVQKPKKPRKPRQKKKTKKELEQERKQQEEFLKKQQQALLEQQQQQKLLMEQQILRQKEMIKQKYQEELSKLPKVYKRTFARNYRPLSRPIQLVNGYDINYISQIGEKVDANKPIFLFPPELGSINLHALNMSLQSSNLGEVNTALNTLLVTSADSMLKITLDKYPDLLDSICVLAVNLLNNLCTQNTQNTNSSQIKNIYDFSKCEDSYCSEYDVKSYLSKPNTPYSRSDDLMDQIFKTYTEKKKSIDNEKNAEAGSENTVSILVDSLTGADLQQVPISLITPAPTPLEMNYDMNLQEEHSNMDRFPGLETIFKNWDFLPPPIRSLSGQSAPNLFVPSYLESLRNVTDEINTPFTKVNTRGAEDKSILITDQVSTISMILRNVSFSEKNSKLMAKNPFLKRYVSDLTWVIFLNHEKLALNRKAFNLKKDLIITLTNISHAYEAMSRVDCFLILMLMLSFGEPKKYPEQQSEKITYPEFLLSLGSYHGFCVDVLAKLMSLNYPNRQFFMDVFMLPLIVDTKDHVEGSNEDIETVSRLLGLYGKGDKYKFQNDIFSFLVSVIPFMQVNALPNLIEDVAPVVSQSLTCLLTMVRFLDAKNSVVSDARNLKNMPLIWLTSTENLGYNLKRLAEVIASITINPDKNSLHMKKMLISIRCKCLELTRLLIQKSLDLPSDSIEEKKIVCKKLASIPGLLSSESQCFAVLTNPTTDPDVSRQTELLYEVRNEVLACLTS